MDTQWSDYGDDEYFFGLIDQKIDWGHAKHLFTLYARLRYSSFTRLVLPHILLVLFIVAYCLFGAYVFYMLERPTEVSNKEIGKNRLDIELNDTLLFLRRFVLDEKNGLLPKCKNNSLVRNASADSNSENLIPVKERIIDLLRIYQRLSEKYKADVNDLRITKLPSRSDRRNHEHWSYASSILFAFTVITTIGYGNLAPVTFYGRLFCIVYGLIGIPATMVAIANVGQFLAEGAELVFKYFKSLMQNRRKSSASVGALEKSSADGEEEGEEPNTLFGALAVCSAFVGYVLIGALCLPIWENVDFFAGCYFAFVTITTIGLGDIVPEKLDFLFPTLVYVTLGLAVTTLTIEVMSQYLRQVHYAGSRDVKDCKNAYVWFGNRMLTVGELVTLIGDRYGIPKGEIRDLKQRFDTVVVQAVQEKAAVKKKSAAVKAPAPTKTPKGPAPLFDDAEFRFIDEESIFDLPATIV